MKNVMLATLFAFGLSAFAQEPAAPAAAPTAEPTKEAAPAAEKKAEKKEAKKAHAHGKKKKTEGKM